MKTLKIAVFAAIIAATGVLGYSSYQKNQKPALSVLALANIEALTQSEGGSGITAQCPNGGYVATGNRTEDTKAYWCKIELSANSVVSIEEKKGTAQAGFKWERLITTAYNCDNKNPNPCVVCNRYVLK